MLQVALSISFAALIFAGSLAPFLSQGIGYALVSAIAVGVVITLFTSWPGFVGGNQDVPAAIMALMAATIARSVPAAATADQVFATVIATVAVTTLLTGLAFLGIGYFHLGGLVRFLPYPVVGGFLAGTGWLLVVGSLSLMAGTQVDLLQMPALLQGDVILYWLPGVLLAVLIMIVSSRFDHYLVLPTMLLLSVVAFFLFASVSGVSLADLSAGGWLLGPFADQGLWQPLSPTVLTAVYWPAVLDQAAGMATIVLVSAISLLLNVGGVELAVEGDIDVDKELRVTGLGNLLAGLAGGLVGYHQISLSMLNYRMQANNRITGLVGVAVLLVTLLAGAGLLGLFPKMVVGALLFLLGLSFIVEWVVEGWSRLPRIDYAIVITILLVTALVGFLQAVALGLLLAVVLFVVGYSRVDVVRHELTGATYHSREVHTREEERLLVQYGEEIYILQLQGFIFFGTADSLLNQIRRRMRDAQLLPLTAVVLDFEHVSGLDSTAMISFSLLRHAAQARNFALVVCGANGRVRKQLELGGLSEEDAAVFYFDTVDHGVAWCEKKLLERLATEETPENVAAIALLARQLMTILSAERDSQSADGQDMEATIMTMLSYFEHVSVDADAVLIRQGQAANSLFILQSGRVTARLNTGEDAFVRLEALRGRGQIVGEIGFFLGGERTADVVAEEPSTAFRFTHDDLIRMEAENPQAASLLRRLIVNVLAERVTRLTNTVRALER